MGSFRKVPGEGDDGHGVLVPDAKAEGQVEVRQVGPVVRSGVRAVQVSFPVVKLEKQLYVDCQGRFLVVYQGDGSP